MFSCVGSMPSAPNAAYISAAQPPRSDAVRGTDFSISACTSTGLAGGVADGGPLAQLAINAAIPPVQRATAKHERAPRKKRPTTNDSIREWLRESTAGKGFSAQWPGAL